MKKIVAVLLAVLLLCGAAFAMTEEAEKITVAYDDSLSLRLRCPEGYTMVDPLYVDGFLFLQFLPENEADVRFTVMVCADDEYDQYPRLNDLSEEQLQEFIDGMVADWHNPKIEIRATGMGSKIVVADEQDAEMDYVQMQSIYHGYFISTYMTHLDGSQITEEEIQKVLDFHTDMDFVFSGIDGQNPVMNVIGDYVDSNSQRAMLNIQAVGEGGSAKALLTVHWANSASDGVEWELPCDFDQQTLTFTYEKGVKKEYVAKEDGTVTYTNVVNDLSGFFTILEDGTIIWHDNGDSTGNGCTFVYNL